MRIATMVLGSIAALALLASPHAAAGPANGADRIELAQLQLNFGVSDATVLRSLRREGYTEIKIIYRGMTKARVQACKSGVRWQMEVAPSGRIKSSARIGECRSPVNIAEAREILRRKGYEEIMLEETGRGDFRGTACLARNRIDIEVDPFGTVRERGVLGRCRQLLSRPEVAAALRAEGYNRIKIAEDRPPPPFFVEACKNRDRVKLVVVGNGRVQRERRIGRCDPPINPNRIAAILQRRGFTRVSVTDDVLPRYEAEACRGDKRVEVVLNRFGEIREEREVGKCAARLTREQLIRQLGEEGFSGIKVTDRGSKGFLVEACLGDERVRIDLSLYGETRSERVVGPCTSPQVDKLIGIFEGRGLSRVKLYVEGCRRGRRLKIEIDEFGNEVSSRRVGRCQ